MTEVVVWRRDPQLGSTAAEEVQESKAQVEQAFSL